MQSASTAAPETGQRLKRSMRATAAGGSVAKIDPDSRELDLTFSSESPVARWWGDEVLSHAPNAADLTRLNDGAPLLFNHNMDDVIGVVQKASIGRDRRGHATVRFARTPRAEEIVGMINDGVLRNVSFMYEVDDYIEEPQRDLADGSSDQFVAAKWRVYEISIVSVPADQSVGIGRSYSAKDQTMNEQLNEHQSRGQRRTLNARLDEDNDRIESIHALGRHYKDERRANELAVAGASLAEVRRMYLDELLANPSKPVAAFGSAGADLDLSEREVQKFSIVRALNAAITNDWSEAGFERDCSHAVAKQLGRSTRGFFVPADVQSKGRWKQSRVPYIAGNQSAGGSLIETQLMADHFIDALRPTAQVMAAGATVLSGLVGNVDIPRQIGRTPVYWIDGDNQAAVGEGEAAFDKVTLTPKTVGGLSKMSRLTLLQTTPAIEMLVRSDLTKQIGLAIDAAALSGTGTGWQPHGLLSQTVPGLPSPVVAGPNGGAVTLDHLVDLETLVAESNADEGTRAYFLNAATIGTLKKIKSTTGQYLWTQSPPGQRSGTPSTFNGCSVYVTNQMPSNLTKGTSTGVCSALAFGAWSDLLIGQWGVLEILVNPFGSGDFERGTVAVRALQTVDIQFRHGASFSIMLDALTP